MYILSEKAPYDLLVHHRTALHHSIPRPVRLAHVCGANLYKPPAMRYNGTTEEQDMNNYVYCEPCKDVHTEAGTCQYAFGWIKLGEFPSRHEAITKARWYGYTVWKSQ